MGNETSSQPSGSNTPDSVSEYYSSYTLGQGSRRAPSNVSTSSSRQLSPVDPPEPDLSHLTEEEKAQITAVLERARWMHEEEETAARQLEEEYSSYAAKVVRRASLAETEKKGAQLCPICHKTELTEGPDRIRFGQNVCKDCARFICEKCGSFDTSLTTNLKEWVCNMCQRRRRLVLSTGLWYHGYESGKQLQQVQRLLNTAELHAKASHRKRPPLERSSSLTQYENLKEYEHKQEEKEKRERKPLTRQGSLPTDIDESEAIQNGRPLSTIRESSRSLSSLSSIEGDSFKSGRVHDVEGKEKQLKCNNQVPYETPDSHSNSTNQFSFSHTRPSSLSFDNKQEKPRASPPKEIRRLQPSDKKRPEPDTSTKVPVKQAKHIAPADIGVERRRQKDLLELEKRSAAAAVTAAAYSSHHHSHEFRLHRPGAPTALPSLDDRILHRSHSAGERSMSTDSSTSPRSLSPSFGSPGSYRDSPPRSPLLRKLSPPLSPHEDVFPIALIDISPPHDGFENMTEPNGSPQVLLEGDLNSNVVLPTTGNRRTKTFKENDSFPPVKPRRKEGSFEDSDLDYSRGIDLATFAATIASDTYNLTSLTASPTHLLKVGPDGSKEYADGSPESSPSPVSPIFLEEIDEGGHDIDDPTEKEIDYQGTQRQKARPPSNDWSPVTDLSPIIDVSPSIEEEAQREMLAQQEQEKKAQQAQLIPGMITSYESEEWEDEDVYSSTGSLKRSQRFDDISTLGFNGSAPKRLIEYIDSFDSIDSWDDIDPKTKDERRLKDSKSPSKLDGDPNANYPATSEAVKHVISETVKATVFQGDSFSDDSITQTNEHARDARDDRLKGHADQYNPTQRSEAKINSKEKECRAQDVTVPPSSEQLQALVASSVKNERTKSDFITGNTSASTGTGSPARDKNSKGRPTPLILELPSKGYEDGDSNVSPHYKVLDSPRTPREQRQGSDTVRGGEYKDEGRPYSPGYTSTEYDEETYWYPSPVPTPEYATSPPVPRSPSYLPKEEELRQAVEKLTQYTSDSISDDEWMNLKGESNMDEAGTARKQGRRRLPSVPGSEQQQPKPVPPPKPAHLLARKHSGELPVVSNNTPPGGLTVADTSPSRGMYKNGSVHESPSRTMKVNSFEKTEGSAAPKEKGVLVAKRAQMFDTPKRTLPEHRTKDAVDAGKRTPAVKDTQGSKTAERRGSSELKRQTDTAARQVGVSKNQNGHRASVELSTDQGDVDDEDINVYGYRIPTEIKTLKQQLKEELKLVVATRRKYYDEMEEIRALEKQLDEIRSLEDKQRVELNEKLQLMRRDTDRRLKSSRDRSTERDRGERDGGDSVDSVSIASDSSGEDRLVATTATTSSAQRKLTPVPVQLRMSPQASPRRARHKKQTAESMVAQFSPIKEDNDIESDFQARLEAERIAKSLGTTIPDVDALPGGTEAKAQHARRSCTNEVGGLDNSTSSPNLSKHVHDFKAYVSPEAKYGRLSVSASDLQAKQRLPHHPNDEIEKRYREEKKQHLQLEIEKRKRQIEENAMLQGELRKIAESNSAMEISQATDFKRSQSHDSVGYRTRENIPIGIIKPLEDKRSTLPQGHGLDERQSSDFEDIFVGRKSMSLTASRIENYSSSEYLAHKTLHGEEKASLSSSPYKQQQQQYTKLAQSQPSLFSSSKDSGMSSSHTLAEWPQRSTVDLSTFYDGYSDFSNPPTEGETSPHSESPPPMPLLDDVTRKSRRILHGIGSRPLSEEFDQSFNLFDAMHRYDSTDSLGDPNERLMEHLTEGGITILKQMDRKKHPPPLEEKRYPFPTKRILLTRDPKDRSYRGNSVGLKIVGGKFIPGTNEVGAYVAKIYPGGVAHQLHGELQEGDHILEWNGIPLTGKTYEEVQKVVSIPNGEIDIVVKVGSNLLSPEKSGTISSSQSSYDNLEFVSADDLDNLDNYVVMHKDPPPKRGVDPKTLAAHLEGAKERTSSPAVSPSSSHPEVFLTPSASTPSPLSDVPETSKQPKKQRGGNSGEKRYLGDLQLQLSYDNRDQSLNVHIIQARNLLPKDRLTGCSDPFVKVYLLPDRNSENKRRTDYVRKTLNPQWHQSFVFFHLPREELPQRTLEITVWDYDRFKPNDFLGEVLLRLSNERYLDNKPHWYTLHPHMESHSSLPTSRDLKHQNERVRSRSRPRPEQPKGDNVMPRSASQPPSRRNDRMRMARRAGSLEEDDDDYEGEARFLRFEAPPPSSTRSSPIPHTKVHPPDLDSPMSDKTHYAHS
ncbi:uncharacterized protein LOC106175070 isoform X3 [Lingula anatina]|uniref:Uncharacterized protein LOC106175070 isoform X3 n=2 Tax=Lingula anatina TaxID=7574 RepID=A0A1S3JQB3_LINAN|nr:uncharacterized protein LOC106175070 isoform X3 [Lingula anatina]|eukprot:XP_013412341.1 uncharacterized protein LOC106175070 isoform X3 [Lingula anatina]